jgi:hypothetical protein
MILTLLKYNGRGSLRNSRGIKGGRTTYTQRSTF